MVPILKNILFKPLPSEEKTESGLYVPQSYQQVNNKGIVVAIGNRVTKVREGEVVFRTKDWGTEIIIDGEKHFLMHEDAILSK